MLTLLASCLVLAQAPAAAAAPVEEVHPAFSTTNLDAARRAYQDGKKHGKDDLGAYLRSWGKDLGKVNSAKGWTFTASNAVLFTPLVLARMQGCSDAKNYADTKVFEQILDEGLHERPEDARIYITATLYAWPGANWRGDLTYDAKQADVKDVNFVVLVDGDPNRVLHLVEPPKLHGSNTLNGDVTNVNVHTDTVTTNSTGRASAYGSNGSSATAYGYGSSTATVTYNTYDVEGFKAYNATWELSFPLYDESGKPLVPSTAKSLVLKVIRPKGELSTKFDLARFTK